MAFCAFAGLAGAQAVTLDEARAKVVEAEAAGQAAVAAQQQDDMQKAQEQSALARERMNEARDLYRASGVADSGSAGDVLEYTRLLIRLGDFDLAEDALIPAIQRNPGDARLWMALGQALSGMGDDDVPKAAEAFRKTAELATDDPDLVGNAFGALAMLYYKHGLYGLAREQAEKARDLTSDQPQADAALAGCLLRDGNVVAAAQAFDELSADPQLMPLVQDVMTTGLRTFDTIRQWFPDTAENHFAYARLLVRVNRLGEGSLALERSLELDDSNYAAWNMAGGIYVQMGQTGKAIDAYQRSLEINADQDRTRQMLERLQAAPQ